MIENSNWSQKRLGFQPNSLWKAFLKFSYRWTQYQPEKKSYQASVHRVFSLWKRKTRIWQGCFLGYFCVWVTIFDPTLVQYFIQIPHIIFFCPLSAYDKWWFEQQKLLHFREKYLVLSKVTLESKIHQKVEKLHTSRGIFPLMYDSTEDYIYHWWVGWQYAHTKVKICACPVDCCKVLRMGIFFFNELLLVQVLWRAQVQQTEWWARHLPHDSLCPGSDERVFRYHYCLWSKWWVQASGFVCFCRCWCACVLAAIIRLLIEDNLMFP